MGWKMPSNEKQGLAKRVSFVISILTLTFIFTAHGFAVTKFKGIQPGTTTKEEVSGILGQPTKEITPSVCEYSSSQSRIEKIVIEYKTAESKQVVDRIDVHFSKPVARAAQVKQMELPDNPDSQGADSEGSLQEYYGSTKSLILTYKDKTTESGIKIVSFLSRDRFESMSKEIAKKPEEPKPTPGTEEAKKPITTPSGEEKKKPTDGTEIKETAKLTPEAKLHLQQGMTYVSLAQTNPKTASQNYENAAMEFTNAIKLYPDYAEAYSNRGVAYMQQKKYNKAEVDLKKAGELKPKDAIIHYNLAALYSIQNKIDLALDSLDSALENGFSNYDALKPTGKQSDADLKNLREHPEFRKVLEKHKVFILK